MKNADLRINYFRNKTKNIIDRDENFEFEQFDKQIRTGVELQARFDSGRFLEESAYCVRSKTKFATNLFPFPVYMIPVT